jgi:hypothetical protein
MSLIYICLEDGHLPVSVHVTYSLAYPLILLRSLRKYRQRSN